MAAGGHVPGRFGALRSVGNQGLHLTGTHVVDDQRIAAPQHVSDLEYDGKKRKTRREIFLERMDSLIPWGQIEERIRPFYPKAGRGRRPYELSVMLRIHCVQLFYNLSDPGMEDILYEVESVRRFVGLRLSGPLPDETTILNFRHLLEEHALGQSLFEEINRHLESQGLRLREETIVDASIIEGHGSSNVAYAYEAYLVGGGA